MFRKLALTTFLAITFKISLAAAAAPTVCFSPEGNCDQVLADFVASATKSVDVAIYDINLDQLVHQLLVKSKSMPVRVLVDKRQASSDVHSLVSTLIKGGVKIRYGVQKGIMHNKFTIVDGARLETGSFNYTYHASKANNENQIYLDVPATVKAYADRFEEIWAKGRAFTAAASGRRKRHGD